MQNRILNRDGSFNVAPTSLDKGIFEDVYHTLLSASWPKFLGLVLIAYFSINLLFAGAYFVSGPDALLGGQGFLEDFYFSVQTFATIGYGKLVPNGFVANLLVAFEALTGLMVFALFTGLIFSRFSKPTARVRFSDVALIAPHDGVRSFVFRMANQRMNQIVEAQVNVVLSRIENTAEGETYRVFYDLALDRAKTPIFALTWTVVHPINPESPLFGATLESLENSNTEIIVSINGIDNTVSQQIHARFSYLPREMVWDRYYSDMIGRNENGQIRVQLSKISELRA